MNEKYVKRLLEKGKQLKEIKEKWMQNESYKDLFFSHLDMLLGYIEALEGDDVQ